MSKGTIIGLIIAIVVIIAGVVGFAIYRNSNTTTENNNIASNQSTEKSTEVVTNNNQENTTINSDEENNTNITTSTGNKTLVVYYSAQTHTRRVAERVAENLNADIFEIVPEDIYSDDDLDWTNSNSRVSKEHNDESLRDIKLKTTDVPNWDDYDIVIIGYPIWWGVSAWPTDTFVKANDFTGKAVIPFCTSYSSGIGQSDKLLKNEANGGDWKSGQRFYQDVDLSEVDKWTNGLGL